MLRDNAPVTKISSYLFTLDVTALPPVPPNQILPTGKVLAVAKDFNMKLTNIDKTGLVTFMISK